MVPSSADIVLHNRRISQSETINLNIRDVVNTISRSARVLAAIKMPLCQYFRLLLDFRDIWIYPNKRTMACALMPTNYFVNVVLPSRQIKRVASICLPSVYYTDKQINHGSAVAIQIDIIRRFNMNNKTKIVHPMIIIEHN